MGGMVFVCDLLCRKVWCLIAACDVILGSLTSVRKGSTDHHNRAGAQNHTKQQFKGGKHHNLVAYSLESH